MTRSGQVVLDDASSDKCLKVNADFRRRFVFGETGDEGYRSSCEDIPPAAYCYIMLGGRVPGHSKWNLGKDRRAQDILVAHMAHAFARYTRRVVAACWPTVVYCTLL